MRRIFLVLLGFSLPACPEPRQLGGGLRVASAGLTARLSVLSPPPDEGQTPTAEAESRGVGGAAGAHAIESAPE